MKNQRLKYIAVRDQLANTFDREQYQAGQQLPTENELSRSLGVSRTTVRQALELLTNQGIIVKRQGSGTYYQGIAEVPEQANHPKTKKGFIGLVNFNFMGYIYPEIIQGMEETLAKEGYSLAIAPCNQNHAKETESVERLVEQGVKGLIIEPSQNLQINESHPLNRIIRRLTIPVVTTHWGITNQMVSTVSMDDVMVGFQATKYLLDRGHRRIGYIMKSDVQAGHDRFTGYKKALTEAGIAFDPARVSQYTLEDEEPGILVAYNATMELLNHPGSRPSAIFYFNDQTAQQGYRAIQDSGLRIPENISVISVDNYRPSALMYPPLTTFEHPKYELGRWAAKILLSEMEPRSPKLHMKMVFEPVLVERKSVGLYKGD